MLTTLVFDLAGDRDFDLDFDLDLVLLFLRLSDGDSDFLSLDLESLLTSEVLGLLLGGLDRRVLVSGDFDRSLLLGGGELGFSFRRGGGEL